MRAALRTKTGRHTQLVFFGQIATAAAGFGINVLLLRCLSVDEYGLFSLFLSTQLLLMGFMHMGWIETFVRFGAKFLGAPQFDALRSYLLRKTLVASAGVGLLAAAAGSFVSQHLYHRPPFTPYFRAAVLTGFLMCVFTFFQSDYRARQDFNRYVITQVGSNAARLLCVAVAIPLGVLGLPQTVAIYLLVTAAFIGFCVVDTRTRGGTEPRAPLDPGLIREMKSYNGWLLLSFFTTNVTSNIDSHVLAYYHANETLSSFAAASRLTLPLQFAAVALQTTLMPRLSAAKDRSEFEFYLGRMKLFVVPFLAVTSLACWLAPPVLIWLAGPHYAGISSLIRLQIVSNTIMLLVNPVGIVVYAWGWTRLLAFLNLAQLAVDLALDLLWIPRWGAAGAVGATLVMNVLGLVVIYIALWWGMRREKFV
ncbi:oligosaccharide flippase family protein [Pendulispora albinea]|uniref:Oligosaccharide flippase family protein n=1 Tax=Pendulispora albinea TaxID=2741071 RepID=A0ABZ2LL82_9BACT